MLKYVYGNWISKFKSPKYYHMNNRIFIIIFVIVVFILGGLLYIYNPNPVKYENPNEKDPIVCTADAKLCPDGSYVGRVGPNCEFVCPETPNNNIPPGAIFEDGTIIEEDEPVFCTADAKLCPDGSYVGRVGPNCEFAQCP